MNKNVLHLFVNILFLTIAIIVVGSLYGWNPKEAPFVILIGIIFPFIVALISSLFIKNDIKAKKVSIILSPTAFIVLIIITNFISSDAFFMIALVLGSLVILLLGSLSINIFFLIKDLLKNNKS